ncbi:hypothetical protein LCGC14_1227760 [marine sediment metagenome]|uniref:Methyltransferase FkbM domain-containing protein n=1 Tax=marine sediment metagenome TaxID=412755 RepID=A0A0F9NRN1_9ZZZZ
MIKNIQDFSEGINTLGEDGIIEAIFKQIGTESKYYVEFGITDGWGDNTRVLKEKENWNGLWMDWNKITPVFEVNKQGMPNGIQIGERDKSPDVKIHTITAENINSLFQKYEVPKSFDLLVIDVDFNDFYLWKALIDYEPRVVMIEYNACYPPPVSIVIKYEPETIANTDMYFGASFCAMVKLGKEKGYTAIGCDLSGSNIFFIRDDLVEGNFTVPENSSSLYQAPIYIFPPPTSRPMLEY